MDELETRGIKINKEKLVISDNAHIVTAYHKLLDAGKEEKRGKKKLGTTARGIGPAYTDKISRSGIRVRDIFDDTRLKEKIKDNLAEKNFMLKNYYNKKEAGPEEIFDEIVKYRERIRPFVKDTMYLLNDLLEKGKKILFEGAQGALLDIDFGTYPYVTSSNPTIGGVTSGAGVSPKNINKAYILCLSSLIQNIIAATKGNIK